MRRCLDPRQRLSSVCLRWECRTLLNSAASHAKIRAALRTIVVATITLGCTVGSAQERLDDDDKERWFAEVRSSKRVSATITESPIAIDGQLDELAWDLADLAAGFYQQVPDEGAPATEATEARFLYDADNLYVGVRLYESAIDRLITNELKRDFTADEGDVFSLVLDTFHDGRNSVAFATNPSGAKLDLQAYDEGRLSNENWDAVWHVSTGRFEGGWTVEMALPFKSLRFFESAESQEWGLQMMRLIRRKNEVTMWSPVARQFNEFRNSYHGLLAGIRQVRPGRDFWIKPFVTSSVHGTSGGQHGVWSNDPDGGLDLKYGIASSLTLDASWRTDFAQVEADTQQINLTRFSLFFPEQREFFLENQGSFQVGDLGRQGGGDEPVLVPFSVGESVYETATQFRLSGGHASRAGSESTALGSSTCTRGAKMPCPGQTTRRRGLCGGSGPTRPSEPTTLAAGRMISTATTARLARTFA